MDAPVEAALEPTESLESLPDASEPTSFEASLEAAFANLDTVDTPDEDSYEDQETQRRLSGEDSDEEDTKTQTKRFRIQILSKV
jgi:hypothetical protein